MICVVSLARKSVILSPASEKNERRLAYTRLPMTFASRFLFTALSLCLLPTVLLSVPLHPETEMELRSSGQFEIVRAAYLDATTRGLDRPTDRPIDLKAM